MENFSSYITEQKNTHMTHIEDKVLYGGVKGTREAILALRSLRDMLKGTHAGNVSVKWDGAPAIFAGIDPSDDKFFVAKKGIFNKNPKVYKSAADVDADTSGDLAEKLVIAYKELKDLGITDVIQGDVMFTKGDLNSESIDGEKYITFQPNTLVYAVPVHPVTGAAVDPAVGGAIALKLTDTSAKATDSGNANFIDLTALADTSTSLQSTLTKLTGFTRAFTLEARYTGLTAITGVIVLKIYNPNK